MAAISSDASLTLTLSRLQVKAITRALALGNYTPRAGNSPWHCQHKWSRFQGALAGFGWHCPTPKRSDDLAVFSFTTAWQGLWLIDRGHTAAGTSLLRRNRHRGISPEVIAADAIAAALEITGGAV